MTGASPGAPDPSPDATPEPAGTRAEAGDEGERPGLGDLVGGGLAAVLGVAIVLHVRGFPSLPDGAPGPALFPGILGTLLAVFGLILVVRWVRYRPGAAASRDDVEAKARPEAGAGAEAGSGGVRGVPGGAALVNAGAVLGAVVLYLLLADMLGFAVTLCLLLFGLMWRLGARPVVAAASSIAATALIYVLFVLVLLVPLPTGPFG